MRATLFVSALLGAWLALGASALAYTNGDIMASTGQGIVKEFTPNGTLVRTLDTGTGASNTTGSSFDAAGNFYVTNFSSESVTKFDASGSLVGPFGSGYNADPESITFDSKSNAYVGQADGSGNILKFDPSGNLLASFAPAREGRGTDWVALAADDCTLFYTSEGRAIKRFNVCTNLQLPDFAANLPGSRAYQIRLLPRGGALVADTSAVLRLDASGNVAQTYQTSGENEFFAAEASPDGSAFWGGDLQTGDVVEFDLVSGKVTHQFNTAPGTQLAGLTVVGTASAAYVALGDSVSAGYGLGHDDNPSAYPGRLTSGSAWPAQHGYATDNLSISGASSADVLSKEMPKMPPNPKLVTLTVGADDINFGGCARAFFTGQQNPCFGSTFKKSLGTLDTHLRQIYGQLSGAQIYQTEYYNPMPPAPTGNQSACVIFQAYADYQLFQNGGAATVILNPGTARQIAAEDQSSAYTFGAYVIGKLNTTIANAAKGFSNVHVVHVNFSGHDLCAGSNSWVFGPSAHLHTNRGVNYDNDMPYACPHPPATDPKINASGNTYGVRWTFSGGGNCLPHPTYSGQQALADLVSAQMASHQP